jgi:hypothetical protein
VLFVRRKRLDCALRLLDADWRRMCALWDNLRFALTGGTTHGERGIEIS